MKQHEKQALRHVKIQHKQTGKLFCWVCVRDKWKNACDAQSSSNFHSTEVVAEYQVFTGQRKPRDARIITSQNKTSVVS